MKIGRGQIGRANDHTLHVSWNSNSNARVIARNIMESDTRAEGEW